MKAASITLIFLLLVLKLPAQPDIYPDMKIEDIDSAISPISTVDSLVYAAHNLGGYGNNPFLRIKKTNDGIPTIVECLKYVYHSPVDSVPVERGEGVFDENGNFICSSRYAWDYKSSGWKLSEKRENYYDASGRDTSSLVYQYSMQENKMLLVYKWSVVYNELNNVISDRRYSYFMHSNTWIETSWEYTYDNQGNLLEANHYFKDNDIVDKLKIRSLQQNYDEDNNRISREVNSLDNNGIWIGLEKTEWEYDSEGRKIKEIAYDWKESENKWSFARKSEYSIDNSDLVRIETIYIFDDNIEDWILNRQIEFEYDIHLNMVSKSCSEYDPFSAKWTGAYRFDYTFDEVGREINSIQYDWDSSLKIWMPQWNKRMSYGFISYRASYYWSSSLNDWIGDWKRETLFNIYEDYFQDAYYEWDSANSEWGIKSGIKWDRIYDAHDHEIEAIGYNWEQEILDWVPGGKFEWVYNDEEDLVRNLDYAWDPDRDDWILYSKTFYNYRKGFVTGLPEEEQDNILIYPNPARSFFKVDGIEDQVTINIYSVTGNLMLRKENSHNRLDISALPNGIYIIVIRKSEKILLSKKLVKQ